MNEMTRRQLLRIAAALPAAPGISRGSAEPRPVRLKRRHIPSGRVSVRLDGESHWSELQAVTAIDVGEALELGPAWPPARIKVSAFATAGNTYSREDFEARYRRIDP